MLLGPFFSSGIRDERVILDKNRDKVPYVKRRSDVDVDRCSGIISDDNYQESPDGISLHNIMTVPKLDVDVWPLKEYYP